MSTQAGVLTETVSAAAEPSLCDGSMPSGRLAAVTRPQNASLATSLRGLGSSPNSPPSRASDLRLRQPSDLSVSVDGSAGQPQDSHAEGGGTGTSSGDTEPYPSQGPSSESATAPPTRAPDNVWEYTVPVPGSKNNKLIYLKAPFRWGQWTEQQWHARYVVVKNALEAMVYNHLRLLDYAPSYSPRMVGTCPTDARPSIVVTCREVDFKNIRRLFRERAEAPLCLGSPSTLSKLRSRFGQHAVYRDQEIPRLRLVYYQTRKPPVIRRALEEPLLAYLGEGGVSCGGMIRYGERSATLGITLDIGDCRGILTVDHLFSAKETDQSLSDVAGESLDFERPSTPVSLDSDQTGGNSLWEDDDEYDDLGPDELSDPGCPQAPEASGPSSGPVTRTTRLDSEPWNKLTSSSQLTPSAAYLDWALTWPTSPSSNLSLSSVNTVFPDAHGSKGVVLATFQEKPSAHLAPVYIVSGIRGILHGQILSVPSFLPSFPGGESCEAWTVLFDAPYRGLVSGECGSVVVDTATNKVYGHVVGSDPLGHAYVVPLADVLHQIAGCFGGEAVPRFAACNVAQDSSQSPADRNAGGTAPDAQRSEEEVPGSDALPASRADQTVRVAEELGKLSMPEMTDEREKGPRSIGRLGKSTYDTASDQTEAKSPLMRATPGDASSPLAAETADLRLLDESTRPDERGGEENLLRLPAWASNNPSAFGGSVWGEWSDWEWDGSQARWWRARQDEQGNIEHRYYDFASAGPGGVQHDLPSTQKITATLDDNLDASPYVQGSSYTYGDSTNAGTAQTNAAFPVKGKGKSTSYLQDKGSSKKPSPKPFKGGDSPSDQYVDELGPLYQEPDAFCRKYGDTASGTDLEDGPSYESTSQDILSQPFSYPDDPYLTGSPYLGTEPSSETLGKGWMDDSEPFQGEYVVEHSSKFRPGSIFKMLWCEPAGSLDIDATSDHVRVQRNGRTFYQGSQRFIVVANDEGHCTCVPILTYERTACTKRGVKPAEHGIIYQAGKTPRMLPGEPKLGFDPVRALLSERTELLVKESRVNYAKLTTVEHSFPVYFIGIVHPDDFKHTVVPAVDYCWDKKKRNNF